MEKNGPNFPDFEEQPKKIIPNHQIVMISFIR
jgi:hypothetical protein